MDASCVYADKRALLQVSSLFFLENAPSVAHVLSSSLAWLVVLSLSTVSTMFQTKLMS